jgi:hypothetical protein
VQWFATRDLALLGEYGLSAEYRFGSANETRSGSGPFRSQSEAENHGLQLRSRGVRFGASVYF